MEEDTSGIPDAQSHNAENIFKDYKTREINAGSVEEINEFDGMDDWVVMDDLNSGDEDDLEKSGQGEISLSKKVHEKPEIHHNKNKNQKASWHQTFEDIDCGKLRKNESPHQAGRKPVEYQVDDNFHNDRKHHGRFRIDRRYDNHLKVHSRHNDQDGDKMHDKFYSEDSRRRKNLNYQDDRRRKDCKGDGRRRDELSHKDQRPGSSYRDERSHRSPDIIDRRAYESSSYGEKRRKRYRSPMDYRYRSPEYPGDPMQDGEGSLLRERSPLCPRERSPIYSTDRSSIYIRERSLVTSRDFRIPIDSADYQPPIDFGDDRSLIYSGDYRPPIDPGDHKSRIDHGDYPSPTPANFQDQISTDFGSSEQNTNQRITIGGVYFDLSTGHDTSVQDETPQFSQLSFKENMFCPICKVDDTRYRTRFEFHNHWLKTHAKYRNFFPCPIQGCSSNFRSRSKMIEHVLQMHSKEQRFEANFEEILLEELTVPKGESSTKVKSTSSNTGFQNKIWETVKAVAAITNIRGGQQMYPGCQQTLNVQSLTNQGMPAVGNPPIATFGNPQGQHMYSGIQQSPKLQPMPNEVIPAAGNPQIATFTNPSFATFANPQLANVQGSQPIASSSSYLPSSGQNVYSVPYQATPTVGRNEEEATFSTNEHLNYQKHPRLQTYLAKHQSRWDKLSANIGTVKPLNPQRSQQLSATYTASTVSGGFEVKPNIVIRKPVQPQIKPKSPTVTGNLPASREFHNPLSDSGGMLNYNNQSSTSLGVPSKPENVQSHEHSQGNTVIPNAQKLSKQATNDEVKFEPSMCCPVCKSSVRFAKELDFDEHWKLYHVETLKKYDCPVDGCKSAASSQKNLQEHYKVAHNAGEVEVSREASDMLLEVQPGLAENPWFRNPKSLSFSPSHENVFMFKAHTKCPVCVVSEVFVDLQSLQLHWQKFHSKFKQHFLCSNSDCDVSKASIEQLKQHYLKAHNCGNKRLTMAAVDSLDDCHVKMILNPFYLDPSPYHFKDEKLHHIEFQENMPCPICTNEVLLKTLNHFNRHWETYHMKYINEYMCPFGNCLTPHKTFSKLKNHYIWTHNASKKDLSVKTIEWLKKAEKKCVQNLLFIDPANCKFVCDMDGDDLGDSSTQNVIFSSGMTCPICQKKTFKMEDSFKEHWQTVHFKFHQAYFCIFKGCRENKPSISKLKNHYSFQHNRNKPVSSKIMARLSGLKKKTVLNPNFVNPKQLKYLPAGKEIS